MRHIAAILALGLLAGNAPAAPGTVEFEFVPNGPNQWDLRAEVTGDTAGLSGFSVTVAGTAAETAAADFMFAPLSNADAGTLEVQGFDFLSKLILGGPGGTQYNVGAIQSITNAVFDIGRLPTNTPGLPAPLTTGVPVELGTLSTPIDLLQISTGSLLFGAALYDQTRTGTGFLPDHETRVCYGSACRELQSTLADGSTIDFGTVTPGGGGGGVLEDEMGLSIVPPLASISFAHGAISGPDADKFYVPQFDNTNSSLVVDTSASFLDIVFNASAPPGVYQADLVITGPGASFTYPLSATIIPEPVTPALLAATVLAALKGRWMRL